jgi:cardiolipin synthase A/B
MLWAETNRRTIVPMHAAARFLFRALAVALLAAPLQVALAHRAAHNQLSAFVEPGAGDRPVVSLIQSARHSIDLEVYILTDSTVIQALENSRRRGVRVRVLLEEHPLGASRYATEAYTSLKSAGIAVRWANERAFTYTHEKSMVVDGRTAGIFTFNLSYSAFHSNREFGVIDRNVQDARTVDGVFNADWSRRAFRLTDQRIVVSPINSRRTLQTMIDGAKHTIDLYEEEVSDSRIETDMISAARRGVRVRLLTSDGSAGVDRLRAGKVKVELQKAPYIHAKAIVTDGMRVFIGSENISATSLDANREMGIALSSKSLAKVVIARFTSDWHAAIGSGDKGNLVVHVSTQPKSVVRGQFLTITAQTEPNATCAIQVKYPDGYVSRAKALHEMHADSRGAARWDGTSAALPRERRPLWSCVLPQQRQVTHR